jgi:hypothetical protein
MWTRLLFDRSKTRAQVAEYASWPLWKKCAALVGVSAGAISLLLRPCLEGRLILGSQRLGFTQTIIPSDEPILFIVVLTILEAGFAFMLYGPVKVFFFPTSIGGD